jgi:hypothetical protein
VLQSTRRGCGGITLFLLTDLFGLPAHTLLVHGAVVLVPLAAVAFVGLSWRGEWRRAYGLPIAVLAAAGAVFAFLAKQSGESLQRTVRDAAEASGVDRVRFGDHPQQGDVAMIWAFLFALGAAGVFAVDWWQRHPSERRRALPAWAPIASYAITVVPAVLAILGMAYAGHSGAKLVWSDLGNYVQP